MSQEVIVSPGEAASAAVIVLAKSVGRKAVEHPKVTGAWLVGLMLSMLATGYRVSQEAAATYERDMGRAEMSVPIAKAARQLAVAEQDYYYSKGWFSCDNRCQQYRAAADDARRQLAFLESEEAAAMSAVKSRVGVFSEYGVAETRERFWDAFAGGKQFAKRQSMWDLLFTGLAGSSRDESTVSILLRWLIQLLFNFTIGLIGALIGFAFRLWSLVASYQPDPVTAVAFAACALLAASAMVATYLFALYFCAASGVAAVSAAAAAQARLEGRRDPRFRVRAGGPYARGRYRPHYS